MNQKKGPAVQGGEILVSGACGVRVMLRQTALVPSKERVLFGEGTKECE